MIGYLVCWLQTKVHRSIEGWDHNRSLKLDTHWRRWQLGSSTTWHRVVFSLKSGRWHVTAVAFKVRWPFFLRSDLPLPEGVASVTIFVVAIKTYLGVLIEFIPQVGFEEDCETKCLCWWAEIAPEPGGEKREHGLGCLHGRRDGGETCVGCLPNGVRRITVLTELL